MFLTGQAFPRSVRLTESAQYMQVFSANFRASDQYWIVLVHRRKTKAAIGARVGLAIAKKRIARSVDRNRLKRLIRESFRIHSDHLGDIDLVVMANSRCKHESNLALTTSLEKIWAKIIHQCKN